MGANDGINMIAPYILVFFCIMLIICCFMRNCNCGLSARELREIGEHHGEQIRHNDIRLMQQIDALRLQENEELEEAFRIANINRLELAESLVNYAKYLKAKMERERIKDEEEGIIIFINPGDEKPVLGQLIVD